jgi:hypothetical protein
MVLNLYAQFRYFLHRLKCCLHSTAHHTGLISAFLCYSFAAIASDHRIDLVIVRVDCR